jgi:hypothetical protein
MPASFFVRRVEHVFLIKQGENAVVPACAYSLRFKVFVILAFLDKIPSFQSICNSSFSRSNPYAPNYMSCPECM